MPNNTVNFALPYPAPTDEPCDFAEQWCDFTEAINDILATFQEGTDRAIPVVPAALVRVTEARSIINGSNIPFDEVVMDTAGMTDLDADPYTITVPRTGRYTVGAFVEKASSGVVNSDFTVFIDGTSVGWGILDRGAFTNYWCPAYSPSDPLAAGTQVKLRFNTAVAAAQTVFTAWLSVIWHADTEVP